MSHSLSRTARVSGPAVLTVFIPHMTPHPSGRDRQWALFASGVSLSIAKSRVPTAESVEEPIESSWHIFHIMFRWLFVWVVGLGAEADGEISRAREVWKLRKVDPHRSLGAQWTLGDFQTGALCKTQLHVHVHIHKNSLDQLRFHHGICK